MTASAAVARRVVDCYRLEGRSLVSGALVVLRFECGHLDTLHDLPAGFPTTESVTDAILGCPTCASELGEALGEVARGEREPLCATKAQFGYCRCSDVRACND